MNVRFGIIFLVVAMVFAIAQVRSEEAEAETMVRREAAAAELEEMHTESKRSASIDPKKKAEIIARIKKLLNGRKGRNAEAMNMDRERRSPDPLDVKKLAMGILKRLGRSADPSMKKFLEMIKARQGRKAERSADPDPDPGMLDFLKNIPFIGGLMR
uniref:VenA3a n=1 Tax=Hyposoter didymator TaxID=260305 RepID=M4TB30_HYPDD|nr:VenA3a [Hyposoter didymator]